MIASSYVNLICSYASLAQLAFAVLTWIVLGLTAAKADALSFYLTETHLTATQSDGTTLSPETLIGRPFVIGDPQNGGYTVRINATQPDPYRPALTLYDVSFLDPETKTWEPLCNPGPKGLAMAVPIPGYWRKDGTYHALPLGQLTFTCTAGAHVKCLRMGYYPWSVASDGRSLKPYHQACVRMIRADYCGTGKPFTVVGKSIQVMDTTGDRNRPQKIKGDVEAVWSLEGAVCVRRVRVPELYPLKTVLKECPWLREHSGRSCREAVLYSSPEALIANWSTR